LVGTHLNSHAAHHNFPKTKLQLFPPNPKMLLATHEIEPV